MTDEPKPFHIPPCCYEGCEKDGRAGVLIGKTMTYMCDSHYATEMLGASLPPKPTPCPCGGEFVYGKEVSMCYRCGRYLSDRAEPETK